MTNAITSLAIRIGEFVPALNKAGKVTATAEKQAELLNALDSRGILSVALNGKGKISKAAQSRIGGDTLDGLLYSTVKLEGAQVNTLRALLIAEHGESLYSRAVVIADSGNSLYNRSMKGLDGLAWYLKAVYSQAETRWMTAETVKQQERQKAILQKVQDQMVLVGNLVALRDADIARENTEKTAMLEAAKTVEADAKASKGRNKGKTAEAVTA